jgi:predicted amidohydrolase YtcJ
MLAGTDYPIEVIEPLVGLARLVRGRAERAGFGTPLAAPASARLPAPDAFALLTDAATGQTLLSADPRAIPAADIDRIEVLGTHPVPFAR